MPVDIHGKQYVTVAERVQALHDDKAIKDKVISITTEFLPSSSMVICKATLKIGDNTFTGTSAANPTKAIEKQSPYEVAETSAIGRALGFANYGLVEGIATADEMAKSEADPIMEATSYSKEKEILNQLAPESDTRLCTIHDEPMTRRISQKTHKPYYAHSTPSGLCFGSN